jgi:hypothetical protein
VLFKSSTWELLLLNDEFGKTSRGLVNFTTSTGRSGLGVGTSLPATVLPTGRPSTSDFTNRDDGQNEHTASNNFNRNRLEKPNRDRDRDAHDQKANCEPSEARPKSLRSCVPAHLV